MPPVSSIRRLTCSTTALLAAAALSLAGNPPNPGPDVTVGDIPDGVSYGTVGVTNIYAFDLGSTACNNGNVNIRWQVSTPKHPVIAQNVYRYKSGRFEQIGASWVKHGFYASTQSYCSTCNQQGGTVLGVGCSDPYDTGLNGEQVGLGPRSEINPSTGAFPYTYPHPWPPIADALSRRIQISGDDLAPALNPGAQYFGEAMYVTPDDAAADMGWNNASWRPIAFDPDPGAYTLSVSSATHKSEPALFAWKSIDPTVRLAAIDVPGDGRYWLGHSVTQNLNGTWHYEYALLNLNSDRAAAGFTIPIAPGTIVTNVAFKGVPCHSGEPYSNAPWTISFTNTDALAYSVPQTFAQDPNSSALRWGTMCNFRFDADAAPGEGAVSTTLFKPGSAPSAFTIGARTPGGGGSSTTTPQPPNDMCPGALPLHSGENRLSNFGAGDVSVISCSPIIGDLWYTYTFNAYAPGCAGNITIDTCGSEIDTALIVYSGNSCSSTPASEIACAASGPGGSCTSPKGAASITFPAIDGDTFLVRVGSSDTPQGNIVLNISVPFCVAPMGACCAANGSCTLSPGPASCFTGTFNAGASVCNPNPCSLPAPPINDQCSGAIPIGDSALGWPTLQGTNFQADNTVNDVCNFGSTGIHDVWYIYRPAQSGPVAIDTCITPPSGINLDTILNLHAGSCSGPVVDCNDDAYGFCVPGSRMMPTLNASTTYYIRVCGYATAYGDFVLRVYGGGGKPVGACCWGSGCSITAPAACIGPNTTFAGLSTTCNPAFDNFSPCCRADFNHNGTVAVQDIFAYLSDWFASSPSAVFGGNSGPSLIPEVQDIFRFLAAWFVGC